MKENIDNAPLHLKYRPGILDEFFGNENMIVSLRSVLERDQGRPHSFLFTGPSGCGKTTLARIVKKELHCSDNDFYEYNVANVRGIDTIREMIINCSYSPFSGDCRIYLLDESHKLTNDAQNALLKLLEDTPPHVYIILCSTDPDKLLKTIRTRCTTFQVSFLSKPKTISLLKTICEKEKVVIPQKAIEKIANVCNGSPRQALVMLDQVIDIGDDDELLAAIDSLVIGEAKLIDLCRALVDGNSWKIVSLLVKGLDEEPEQIRYAILGYLGQVLLNNGNDRIADLIALFSDSFMYCGKAGLILACYSACPKKN